MKNFNTFLFFEMLMFLGCSKSEITEPPVGDDYKFVKTASIPDSAIGNMYWIYKLSSGSGSLGSLYECKNSKLRVLFIRDKTAQQLFWPLFHIGFVSS
jgi:hypothetical protein